MQFYLWYNCTQDCTFCIHKRKYKSLTKDKIDNLNFVIDKLKSPEMDDYTEIGFIAGDFFDGNMNNPTVKEKFYEMLDLCVDRYKQGKLNKILITAYLIYSPEIELNNFLDYIVSKGIDQIVLFCTSFDLKYRFKSDTEIKQWYDNVKLIYDRTHKEIHVETILTQYFIDAINDKTFDVNKFCEENHLHIDLIPPAPCDMYDTKQKSMELMPDFFPTRKSFLDFFYKYVQNNELFDLNAFLSHKLFSNVLYKKVNNKEWKKIENRWETPIEENSVRYDFPIDDVGSYSDTTGMMYSDVLLLKESL